MTKVSLRLLFPRYRLELRQWRVRGCLLMAGMVCGVFLPFRSGDAATLPRKLAFYVVKPTDSSPTMEGTLGEECWKEAEVASVYYEYWKTNPGPGKLQTEFRMLYSDRGIHIKITNFDDATKAARGKVTRGDDPELWKDDCAQIYFDPAAKGIGFVNFTVNLLGTRGDMKRLDAAVTIPEWSGDEWTARTTVLQDRWVIEAFFPWTDLGATAREGDIWMFDHVRFAWRDERLTGVTWAPGGNYANPRLFGYLYFAGRGAVSPRHLAAALDGMAAPPWMIPVGENVLVAKDESRPELVSIRNFVDTYRAEMGSYKDRLEENKTQPFSAELKNRAEDLNKISSLEALSRIDEIVETSRQLNDLYWQARINSLLEGAPKP